MRIMKTKLCKNICVSNSLQKYNIQDSGEILYCIFSARRTRIGTKSALSMNSNVKSNTYWRYSNSHIIYKDSYITAKSESVA
jgi:hypothetical protein